MEEQTGCYVSARVHPKGSINRSHGIKDSFGGIRHLRNDPQDYSQLSRDREQARGGAEEAAKIMDSEPYDEKGIPLRADLSKSITFSGEMAELQKLNNAAKGRTKERTVFHREEDDDGVNGGRMRTLASCFDENSSSLSNRAAAAVQNPKLKIKLCSNGSKHLSSIMAGAGPHKAMTFSSQNKENIGLVPLCPGTTQIQGMKRKTNDLSVTHGAKKRNCEGMKAAVPLNPIYHHSRKGLPLPSSVGTAGAILRRSPPGRRVEFDGGGPKIDEQSRMDLLLMAVTAANPQRPMQKSDEFHAITSSPVVSKFEQQQASLDATRPDYPGTRSPQANPTMEAPPSNALNSMGMAPPAAARYQLEMQTSGVEEEVHDRAVDGLAAPVCRDKDELTTIERQQQPHRPTIPVPANALGAGSEAHGSKVIYIDDGQNSPKDDDVCGGSVKLRHCVMKPNLGPTPFGDPAVTAKGVQEACALKSGVDEYVDDESTDSDEHLKLVLRDFPMMKVHRYQTGEPLEMLPIVNNQCVEQPHRQDEQPAATKFTLKVTPKGNLAETKAGPKQSLRQGQVRSCGGYTDSETAAAKMPRKLPAAFKGKMVKYKRESRQKKSCSDDDDHLKDYSMDPYRYRPAPLKTTIVGHSEQRLQRPSRQSERGYKDGDVDKYCLKPHRFIPPPLSSGTVAAKSSEGLRQTLRQEERRCDDDLNKHTMEPQGDRPAAPAKSKEELDKSSTRHQSNKDLNTFCMKSHQYRPAPCKPLPDNGRQGFEQQPASQDKSSSNDEVEIRYNSAEEASYMKAHGYVGRIRGVYVKSLREAIRLQIQEGKRPARCSAGDESNLSDTDDGCYRRPHRFVGVPAKRDEETRQTSKRWRERREKGSWSGEDKSIYIDIDERYYKRPQRHAGARPKATLANQSNGCSEQAAEQYKRSRIIEDNDQDKSQDQLARPPQDAPKSQHHGQFTQGIPRQEYQQEQINDAPASKSSKQGSDTLTRRSSEHEKFKEGRRVQFCEPMPRSYAHPPSGRHHPLHRIPKALPSSSSAGARTSGPDRQLPRTNDFRKRKANGSSLGSTFCVVPKQVTSVITTATSCLVVGSSGTEDRSLPSIGEVVVECLPPSSSSLSIHAAQEPVGEDGLTEISSSQADEDSNYILFSQGSSHGKQSHCGARGDNGDVVRPPAGPLRSVEEKDIAAAAAPPCSKGPTTVVAASSLSAGGERKDGGRVAFTIGNANRFPKQCEGMQGDERIVSSCNPLVGARAKARTLAEGVTVIPGNDGAPSAGISSCPSVSITYLHPAATASGSEKNRRLSSCPSTLICSAGQHQQNPSCCSDHHKIAGISLPGRSWEALTAAEVLVKSKFAPKIKQAIEIPVSSSLHSRFQEANNNKNRKDLHRESRLSSSSKTGAGIRSHSYSNPPAVQKAGPGQVRVLQQSQQRQEGLSFKLLNRTVERNLSKLKDINVGMEGAGDIHRLSQGGTPTVHGGQLLGKKSSSCILIGNGIGRPAAVPNSSPNACHSSGPQQCTEPLAPKPIIRRRRGWKRLEKERLKAAKQKGRSNSCKFKLLAEPSGLLGTLNPGIMQRVRNSDQIRSFLGALLGGAAALCQKPTQTQDIVLAQGKMPPPLLVLPKSPIKEEAGVGTIEGTASEVRASADGDSERLENSADPTGLVLGESTVAATLFTLPQEDLALSLQGAEGGRYLEQSEQSSQSGELPAAAQQLLDAKLPDQYRPSTVRPACYTECQVLAVPAPAPAADNVHQRQPESSAQEAPKAISRGLPSAQEAGEPEMPSVSETGSSPAELAGRWLELLIYDIEGRLSALERSRGRVQRTLESLPRSVESRSAPRVLNNVPHASGSFDINVCTTVGSQRSVCSDATNIPPAPRSGGPIEAAADSIRALFANMDNVLGMESAKLMTSLKQIQQMRVLCPGFFNYQQAQLSAPEKVHLVRAAAAAVGSENQPPPERWPLTIELGVAASAASMLSTANFVTKARSFR